MIKEIKNKSEIEEILKKNFTNYHTNYDPFEKILVYIKHHIIGLISYSIIYERAEINYIIVDSQNRKSGIGTKLIEKALNDMKIQGVKNVSLEVSEKNKSAINFYLKHGFEKKAIRNKYYGKENGILMVKRLEVIK